MLFVARSATAISVMTLLACSAHAGEPERHYQEKWCNEHGGQMEVVLDDGARVDCLTDELAVEFDFAKKWAEGYGQAKYYAAKTGRRPMVVLIVYQDDDRYVERLRIASAGDVEIGTISRRKAS